MYCLLIDTSNENLSVGLSEEGKIVDEVSYEAWQRQSELLVDEINKMLKKHSLTRQDLSSVSVSKGPGSYTGVRIALTVAKVTAFALNIPLYLSSSLEVLKDPNKTSICLSNARSKRSYFAVYSKDKTIVKDTILTNDETLAYIKAHPDYEVAAETDYLGIKGANNDPLSNLKDNLDKEHLCENVLSAKPVYLKDNYPV